MQFHPAAAIFPLLEGDELNSLVDSIRANGLRESIKTHDGKILDGRNRMTACGLAGVEPRFEPARVNGSIADYVYDMNYHRRQLTVGAQQLAAGRYKEVAAEEAKERQRESAKRNQPQAERQKVATLPHSEKSKARDAAGEKFGVSGKTVDSAAKVLKHGTPEVVKAVERGDLKVSTAARLVSAPKEVQSAAVQAGNGAIRKAIEQHAPTPSEEAKNDAGVKWHKAMHDITARLVSTREHGGIEELVRRWTPELIEQYVEDITEAIQELATWKRALNDRLKKL